MRSLLPIAAVCLLLAGCGGAGSEEELSQAETPAEEAGGQEADGKEAEAEPSGTENADAVDAEAENADTVDAEADNADTVDADADAETADEEEHVTADTDTEKEEIPSALPGARLNGDTFAAGEEPLRVTYADGFYYEPLSDALKEYITGTSYPETTDESSLEITRDDLRYVHVLYTDFNGETQEGELICNAAIAQDLVEIFCELQENGYPIEQIHLVDEYGGDDDASMAANNTSCFNYRSVAGTGTLSKHALGRAVDINPLYNPYITYNADGSEDVAPPAGWDYVNRSADFAHKIDTNDLCYRLFTEHGFTWGGSWNSPKDYQHFQKEY